MGEKIQRYRGRPIRARHLTEYGRPLALVQVSLSPRVGPLIADLCNADVLRRHEIQPDRTAFRDVRTTQAIARVLHQGGSSGLRWWSAFFGEWHTVVLFADRISAKDLIFGPPLPIALESPVLVQAAEATGVRIPGESTLG